jgi:hypothetical protein
MSGIDLVLSNEAVHHFWTPIYLLAKINSDIELLKAQIEFLTKANSGMADSFGKYISAIQIGFIFIGFCTAFLGGLGTFLYGKSLKEATQIIDSEVQLEVKRQIKKKVSDKIIYLEQVIDLEKVIGTVNIEYLIPGGTQIPIEYQLLDARGFKMNSPSYDSAKIFLTSEIFVLDLINSKYLEDKDGQEKLVLEIADKIAKHEFYRPIFVIYVNGTRLKAVDNLPPEVYCLPANGKVALIGAVVDASHTSHALLNGIRNK